MLWCYLDIDIWIFFFCLFVLVVVFVWKQQKHFMESCKIRNSGILFQDGHSVIAQLNDTIAVEENKIKNQGHQAALGAA